MIWENWSDFFAMGGYALYVWCSFTIIFGFMIVEVILLIRRGRSIRAQIQARAHGHQIRGLHGVNNEAKA